MAKLKQTYSFKNGCISKIGDGTYIITEITKDTSEDFNLSALLDGMLGIEGVSISFGSEDSVTPILD